MDILYSGAENIRVIIDIPSDLYFFLQIFNLVHEIIFQLFDINIQIR